MRLVKFTVLLVIISASYAYGSKCGEFIYNKKGKLRHYNYLNNSLYKNCSDHSSSTSTSGVSTESTTAFVDPGVYTGVSISVPQFSSSRDECKFDWDMFFGENRKVYEEYVAQNLREIKKEMSVGEGGHIDVLARVHRCDKDIFEAAAQKNFDKFIDATEDKVSVFVDGLNEIATANCPHPHIVKLN